MRITDNKLFVEIFQDCGGMNLAGAGSHLTYRFIVKVVKVARIVKVVETVVSRRQTTDDR